MHECIGTLLRMEVDAKAPMVRPQWVEKYPDDEDVECCCKLLGSTGPMLDFRREQDMKLVQRQGQGQGRRGGAKQSDAPPAGPIRA